MLKELQTMLKEIQNKIGECEFTVYVKPDIISFTILKRKEDKIIKYQKNFDDTTINYIVDEQILIEETISETTQKIREKILNEEHPLFGPQEPPQGYRIFNRKQPDGNYRPISEFFEPVRDLVERRQSK